MTRYGAGEPFSQFGGTLFQPPTKRAIFVSYHHDGDQSYYDYFAQVFASA